MTKRHKQLVGSLLTIFLLWMSLAGGPALGQEPQLHTTEERLIQIGGQEAQVMQVLFTLLQDIEEMEKEEREIALELANMDEEIQRLQTLILKEEGAFQEKKEILRQVLKSYQKRGAGSYLEIFLSADSLSTMLQRLNTLRDLTRHTGELLDEMELSQKRLQGDQNNLAERQLQLEAGQAQLQQALEMKRQLVEEQETYLAALEEERAYYEAQLGDVQKQWNELKSFLLEATKDFAQFVQVGNLPEDALKLTFSLFTIKGTLDEEVLNQIIQNEPRLPVIEFRFLQDQVQMSLPEKHLVLTGVFNVQEERILEFQAYSGSFYGLPLEQASLEELFREGNILLDLAPLIGKSRIQSILFHEGYLELVVIPTLF